MKGDREGVRERILADLRKGLSRTPRLFLDGKARGDMPALPSPVAEASGEKPPLARLFGQKLEKIHGGCDIVEGGGAVAETVLRLIGQWNGDDEPVLSWAPEELPAGLVSQLEASGITLYVPDDLHREESRRRAAHLSVGITSVEAAFAGTGTVLLSPAAGRSKAAALLPLYHVVLVPFSRLHPNMETWMAATRDEGTLVELVRQSGQLAFVTGPSKSADIELNLTLGVHGPRMVHAVVFDG